MARIGIIGGGRMGAKHARAALDGGHAIVALIDPDPACATLDAFPDLAAMHASDAAGLTPDGVDVVVVATTAEGHVPLLREGLARGLRRFVVEKPFSRSLAEARLAQAEAEAVGARVIVNHGRRYDPNTFALKALDADGRYGRLRAIFIRSGAGGLGCVGTHWIDLCNNLLGATPDLVAAIDTTPRAPNPRGARFDDPGASVLLMYPGARRATIDVGDDVGIVGGADFLFDFAQVSWTQERLGWRLRRRGDDDLARPHSLYGLPLDEEAFPSQPPDLVAAAGAALADALGDGPPVSGVAQAVETMHVFAACRTAARTRATVALPLDEAEAARVYAIP